MLSLELLDKFLAKMPHCHIALVGDLFLDRYWDINPSRDELSLETGLTAFQVEQVRLYPGALGTVLNNLLALQVGKISVFSLLGDDGEGFELQKLLRTQPHLDLSGLICDSRRKTPSYNKPMRGLTELNRLDIKNHTRTSSETSRHLIEQLERRWQEFDTVLLLDQVSEPGCGVVTEELKKTCAREQRLNPRPLLLADSRNNIADYASFCALKPNDLEFTSLLKADLVSRTELIFHTQGASGIEVLHRGKVTAQVPAVKIEGPIDPVGAGDSCSAAFLAGVAAGATHEEAAQLAVMVASITIRQLGVTGTASPDQLRQLAAHR